MSIPSLSNLQFNREMNASSDSQHGSAPRPQNENLASESVVSRWSRFNQNLKKKLALLLFGICVAFAMTELLLVALGVSFPLLYQPDDFCGTRLRPNLNVRYIEEGNAIVETNSSGFRGKEYQSKDANLIRIAVVGDSFTEAIHVPYEKTFCQLLERKFEKSGEVVEVLNFGVSGFGTAQELEMLNHYVLPTQPDVVILAVFTGNDVGDNSSKINSGQIKPYYRMQANGLILDDSFKRDARFIAAKSWSTQTKVSLINWSRSLQLVNKFYSAWKNRKQSGPRADIGLDPNVYLPPKKNSDWDVAWNVTELLIQKFAADCKSNGAKCLVVTLSNPIQVHPNRDMREGYFSSHGIVDPFYPDKRIEKFCEANAILNLSLAETFYRKVGESDGLFLHGFPNSKLGTGHWNENGHALASELIYNVLIDSK